MPSAITIENTPFEVQRRIAKFEQTLEEMAGEIDDIHEMFGYRFNPVNYEQSVLDFLTYRGIRYERSTAESGSGRNQTTITPKTQSELDIVERVYRLSSKVLKTVKDSGSDPTPQNYNILRALSQLDDSGVIECADKFSEVLSLDNKSSPSHQFAHAILNEGLGAFLESYKVPKLDGKRRKEASTVYKEALNGFLFVAGSILFQQEGDELGASERLARFVHAINGGGSKDMRSELNLGYLERIASMREPFLAMQKLQTDFGELVGFHYHGKDFNSTSQVQFYFLLNGKLNRYVVGSDGRASQALVGFLVNHLKGLTGRNHRGIIYNDLDDFHKGRETESPILLTRMAGYTDLHRQTMHSVPKIQQYF